MSGIAGIIGKTGKDSKKEINMMLDRISHRGGNRELLVMPEGMAGINTNFDFQSKANGHTILMDGRIFNLDDLLKKKNISAGGGSPSDTEKISMLIKAEGRDVFKDLKGSFALAVSDELGNTYLARDMLGRKPLYYSNKDGQLIFASEVKSITGLTSDIMEFPPGSYMENQSAPNVIKTVDTDNYPIIDDEDREVLEERLAGHLLESMDARISNRKLDLGVWLSGGLDSSVVAALLKEFSENIHTYSVGYEGSPDMVAAKRVAEYLGTAHTEYELDVDELFESIPSAIYHLESFDAPLVRSTLGNMIVSRISAASDMVFSGEGGDELFAGYNYFLDIDSPDVIQEELVNAINALHNTALQRVDRTANAFSVNVRLPLLDENLLNYVLRIPPGDKVRKDKNTGKYILRKIAARYLPADIAWRDKDKFWEGSGIEDTLEKKIDHIISDKEFTESASPGGNILRNKEEAYYYRVFREHFPDVDINNFLSFTQDFG